MKAECAFTEADVMDMVQRVWAEGGEGLMLKAPEPAYRRKRRREWHKIKVENWGKWSLAA